MNQVIQYKKENLPELKEQLLGKYYASNSSGQRSFGNIEIINNVSLTKKGFLLINKTSHYFSVSVIKLVSEEEFKKWKELKDNLSLTKTEAFNIDESCFTSYTGELKEKVKYKNEKECLSALFAMKQRFLEKNLQGYKCPNCEFYHIGNKKKLKMKSIPLKNNEWTSNEWIDYQNKVLIIELNNQGNEGKFQFDGCSCRQGSVQGFVFKEFESSCKYFKPSIWYKKTCWGSDYGNKLYFKEKKHKINYNRKNLELTNKLVDSLSKSSKQVLNCILSNVEKNTGLKFELDFENTKYGICWYESYILLKYKNKKYLLTWENCD